jgi:hypothetical protein
MLQLVLHYASKQQHYLVHDVTKQSFVSHYPHSYLSPNIEILIVCIQCSRDVTVSLKCCVLQQ